MFGFGWKQGLARLVATSLAVAMLTVVGGVSPAHALLVDVRMVTPTGVSPGSYGVGATIPIAVCFSGTATVSNGGNNANIKLVLNTNTTGVNYTGSSMGMGGLSFNCLVFNYVVASGDTSQMTIEATSLTLANSATITVGGFAMNDANTALTGKLMTGYGVDKDAPTLLSSSPADQATAVPVDANVALTLNSPISQYINVTSKACATNTVTLTTAAAHGLGAGDRIAVLQVDPGMDSSGTATFMLTSASGSTLEYAKSCTNSAASVSGGAVAPSRVISIGADADTNKTVTNVVLASNVATLTSASHGFAVGDTVVIDAVAVGEVDARKFNGAYVITAADANTFSYAVIGSDVGSVSATAGTARRVVEAVSLLDARVTVSGSTLTFNPTAVLAGNTGYHVRVQSGAIRDTSGNRFAGLLDATTLNFTTAVSAPRVDNITSSTANGSYKSASAVSIQVRFSEPVTVTGTPRLSLNSDATAVASYASGSGTNTLTFTYTVGAADSTATVTGKKLNVNSVELNGGTIVATTGGLAATLTPIPASGVAGSLNVNKSIVIDNAAPQISGLMPFPGAVGVQALQPIVVRLSEKALKVNGKLVFIKRKLDNTTLETITIGANTSVTNDEFGGIVTINHVNSLVTVPATDYYIEAQAGFVTDLAGNDVAAITGSTTWAFTASPDTVAPTYSFAQSDPPNGMTNFDITRNIQIRFSEAVSAVSAKTIRLCTGVDACTTPVETFTIPSSAVTSTSAGIIQSVNPTSNLNFSTTYFLLIDAGAFEDGASNATASAVTAGQYSFTTMAAPVVGGGGGGGGGYIDPNAPQNTIPGSAPFNPNAGTAPFNPIGGTAPFNPNRGPAQAFDPNQGGAFVFQPGNPQAPAQFGSMTPNQMASINPNQFANFNPNQMGAIPPSAMANMNPNQFAAIRPDAMAGFNPSQIGALPPSAMANMNQGQMRALPPEAMSGFKPDQMAALPPQAFSGMKSNQMGQMPPEAMAGMNQQQMQQLPPNAFAGFNPNQIDAMPPAAFSGMKPTQMQQLPPNAFSAFSQQQVSAMPPNAFSGMKPNQMGQMPPDAFSGFSPQQMNALPPTAMAGMQPNQFAALPPTAMSAMSSTQMRQLPPNAMAGMQSNQFAALPPSAMNGFKPDQFAALPPSAMAGMQPNQFAALPSAAFGSMSSKQMDVIPNNALAAITPNQFRSLTAEVLASMSPEQRNALPKQALNPVQLNAPTDGTNNSALVGALNGWNMNQVPANAFNNFKPSDVGRLSTDAFSALSPQQFQAMPLAAFAGFKPDQVGALPPEVFAGMKPNQMGQMPPAAFSSFNAQQVGAMPPAVFAAMKPVQMGQMPPAAFEAMKPTQLGAMPATAFAAFKADQVDAMPPEAFTGMKTSQVMAMSVAAIGSLSGAQVGAMPPTAFAGMKPAQLGALPPDALAVMAPTQVKVLPAAAFAAIKADQIDALTPEAFGVLKSTQIGSLTPAAFGSLSSDQIGSMPVNAFTAIKPAQMAALEPEALVDLSAQQVSAMPAAAFKSIKTDQVDALPAEAFAAMKPAQMSALTPAALGALSPEQAAELPVRAMGAMKPNQIGQIDAATFGALKPAQLAALNAGGSTGVTVEQLDQLTPVQVKALPKKFVAGLNPEQLAVIK